MLFKHISYCPCSLRSYCFLSVSLVILYCFWGVFFVGIADMRDKIEAKREQTDEKSEIDQSSVGDEKEGSNIPDDSG